MSQGLPYSEAAALMLIHKGLSTVKEVASALRLSVEDASRIIANLEAKGLVERVRGGILRRERLRLTKRGLDALPEAAEVLKRASEAAVRAAEEARAGLRPEIDEGVLAALPALLFLGLVPAWVLGALLPLMQPALEYGGEWESGGDQEAEYGDFDIDLADADF